MPNSYFRFKQFIIHQDRCAMKVCTDSCILGAWTALRLNLVKNLMDKAVKNQSGNGVKTLLEGRVQKILDIGSGTALLSLMLAQKTNARIDTIECDRETCLQAGENIKLSPWAERIQLFEGDVREYIFPSAYDFIITNPPFFESDLRSPEQKKNMAKHNESLTFEKLMGLIRTNLQPDGAFSILLPFHRNEYFKRLAGENGFFLQEELIVKQTLAHDPFRSILLFSKNLSTKIISEELTIKKEGKYSLEFKVLMQDYYG